MELIKDNLNWDAFKALPFESRIPYFKKENRLFNILFSKQFDINFLDTIYTLTNKVRLVSKTKDGKIWLSTLLKNYKAMFYFTQPSTRTFLSFATACQTLGITFCDVRNPQVSSEVKGESFEDTIRTFSSYFDLIIMRDLIEGNVEKASFVLNKTRRPISIINAGSGKDEHPTQSLLDIFTLRKSFEKIGGLENKTILMVGDLKRGRTIKSLCHLLSLFSNIKIIFSSPKKFKIENNIKKMLLDKKINFKETEKFESIIHQADAVYMTRLQNEYDTHQKESKNYDEKKYSFQKKHLKTLKHTGVILHPLPRKTEIENNVDEDPRAMYWRQVRNGMWVRVALIAYLFKVDKFILEK